MPATLVVSTVNGCPLCNFQELEALNDRIYARRPEDKDEKIVWAAFDDFNRRISEAEVRAHRKHLVNVEIDTTKLVEEKDLLDEDSSNMDVVRARMNRVRAVLLQMEGNPKLLMSKEYSSMLGNFTKLMELKARLEGQVIEKSETQITVEDIVSRLKKPEKENDPINERT